MRGNHRRSGLICNIDVTAFASVMLALVVMFMVPFHGIDWGRNGPSVDMTRVGHPISMRGALREDAMVIAVGREGKVYFGTDPILPSKLPDRIRERVSHGAERTVYIRADRRAKYGWVKEVLDSVQSSGVEKIGFLVEHRPVANPGS